MTTDAVFVAWIHASLSGFLFRGVQKDFITGLSRQTLLAMTVCSMVLVMKKLWYPLHNLVKGGTFVESSVWEFETTGWVVDAALLLGCTYSLLARTLDAKPSASDKGCGDDFGRSQMRSIWFQMPGRKTPPPTYLHWCTVYAATAFLAFFAGLANAGFSVFALGKWARRHPTGSMALFINILRGVGMLPQLHMSRRSGYVSPGLALWMAMMGVIDVVELLADGIFFTELCYVIGDVITFVVISDFMWIFIKSRVKGKAVVEVPLNYEI
jgi:hypothetical protein